MSNREVLGGSAAPGLLLASIGAGFVLLSLLGDRDVSGFVAGLLHLSIGGSWWATRHTVLDAEGIRPAGRLRRLAWTDVADVRRSCSALHYADVELTVRGQHRLVHLRERRGGADLAAVRSRWLAARGTEDVGPVQHAGRAGPV